MRSFGLIWNLKTYIVLLRTIHIDLGKGLRLLFSYCTYLWVMDFSYVLAILRVVFLLLSLGIAVWIFGRMVILRRDLIEAGYMSPPSE